MAFDGKIAIITFIRYFSMKHFILFKLLSESPDYTREHNVRWFASEEQAKHDRPFTSMFGRNQNPLATRRTMAVGWLCTFGQCKTGTEYRRVRAAHHKRERNVTLVLANPNPKRDIGCVSLKVLR